MRQVLSQQTVRLNLKQLFAGSSSNVYKSVLLGKSAAGAVLDVDFDAQPEDVKAQLIPLVRTPKMAPHPISAHPRVPKQLQQALATTVLKMGSSAEGKKLLQMVQLSDPVPADYVRDYKVLEKMDYDALSKGI